PAGRGEAHGPRLCSAPRREERRAALRPGNGSDRMTAPFHLRPYTAADEDAAIALWRETWQQAYPSIDFAARESWWRERWVKELVPNANIVVAEQDGVLTGFVTIDAQGYLDQLVVAPAQWGTSLATILV